jgi:fumarate reductase subunit C
VTDSTPPGEIVTGVRVEPNGAGGRPAATTPVDRPVRTHPYRQPATWWLRRRGYLLYMVRELTAVPIAIWMVLFLVEVSRLRQGSGGYAPLGGPLFVAAGVVCLAAALWHSFTFLNLAGLIMRIPVGDRSLPARVIVAAAFAAFVVLTAVVASLLIWGGA